MKMKLLSWESEGLRCPDIRVEIESKGKCPRVSLLQMPNGTGKTTTLTMIRAALTGSARHWNAETVRNLRRAGSSNASGKFILKLTIDGRPLTFEIQLDFVDGLVKYRTTAPGSGGVKPDWLPPVELNRFLSSEFVNLFVFDGELAERLLNPKESEAERAIDALCQLYLLDEIANFAEWDWQRVTKRPGPKAQAGLTALKNKHDLLEKQEKKVRQLRNSVVKKASGLEKEIKQLDGTIGTELKQIEGDQKRLEQLKLDEQHKQLLVDKSALATMSLVRKPFLLHPAFSQAVKSLKDRLDKAKLPESSSRQFFVELSQQRLCVCARPIGTEESKAILEHANEYLGEKIAGVLNTLKQDIDLHVGSAGSEALAAFPQGISNMKRDVNLWHKARAAREAHEAGLVRKGGDKLREQNDKLAKLKAEKAELDALLEEEIDRPAKLGEDETTKCLASLKRQLDETNKRIAQVSDTVELRRKTDVIKEVLQRAKEEARQNLRAALVKQCNDRLDKILARDPVLIEDISQSVVLRNQDGASVGQTLAVGYTFLTSLLHRGQHNFPLIVDSPANPIDNNVRREIGSLIPTLCDQFVAFTISSEREGFVSALDSATAGDIRYMTLFRISKGTENLSKELPSKGTIKSNNAILVEGKEYFFKFDLETEIEEK